MDTNSIVASLSPVESSPQEIDPTNNLVSHQFTLEIPNLEMTAVDATGSFFQNSNISVSATVTNKER